MPMLKFTLSTGIFASKSGGPIWINPDKVVAVQRGAKRHRPGAHDLGLDPKPTDPRPTDDDLGWGATIHTAFDKQWEVQESVEDVVGKIEQAKR